MKTITGEEFYELLKSESTSSIDQYSIEILDDLTVNLNNIFHRISISNCNFSGKISFFDTRKEENPFNGIRLYFDKCSFGDLVVSQCFFDELKFINIKSKGNIFSIRECQIYSFEIASSTIQNEDFVIHHNKFITQIHLKDIRTEKGKFSLRKNVFPINEGAFYKPSFINNCQFINCDIYENDFGYELSFLNNTLTDEDKTNHSSNYFKKCIFGKSSFYNTDFGESTKFLSCDFNGATLFENIKNDFNTALDFKNDKFKNTVSFNKTKIHKLNFDNCVFENYAFFQETYFDIIKIDKSIFEKSAFFDDVKIMDIDKCDRRTIRNIKLHLQKVENKIDYNKFRVYEFDAYKADLKKQIDNYKKDKNHFYHRIRDIKHLRRDLFILNLTGFYSDYGTDWKKALKFTLLFGLLLYVTFFIFENCSSSWDINEWQVAPIGFLRFFILTDFYNPLADGKTYISNNGWNHLISWIIFIFGKVVIAFGIYEMIQAFRKFKA